MHNSLMSDIETQLKPTFKYPPLLTASLLMALVVVWSTLYLRIYIDVDTAWLLECLDRFIAGGTYTKDFYETNPPLSFWIYLPAYPLYTFMGISAKTAVFIVLTLYLGIADVTLFMLLRKYKTISLSDLFVVISALIMAQSWVSGTAFGSKDHLIMAFLLPLSLYQYRVTNKEESGKTLATISIVIGALAICLKPYYAIIPALFFLHRLYTTRSILRIIIAPDFLGMLAIGITYILSVWIMTPEYFEVLPQVITLYSKEHPFPLSSHYYYVAYALVAAIGAPFIYSGKNEQFLKTATLLLAAFSLISIIPYVLQDKGFHYQALPTLGFGVAAGFITVFGIAKSFFKEKRDIALWFLCAVTVILFCSYTYSDKHPKLTTDQFMALPLIDKIDELAWNRTYANFHYRHMLAGLPEISSLKNGTRFGALWPLTSLTEEIGKTTDPERREMLKHEMYKVVDMMAEDMKRYKPSVVIIPQYADPETEKPAKNYYNFLIKHALFKENMDNYTYYDTIIFDTSLAPEGKNTDPSKLVPHDIFVLNRENTL